MRYRLRTLLIVLAVGPLVSAWLLRPPPAVPLLAPIMTNPSGSVAPPSDLEVIQAWARLNSGKASEPLLAMWRSGKVRVTKRRISHRIEAPRTVPLVGHVVPWRPRYRCTIRCQGRPAEVFYIDHNGFKTGGGSR